MKTCKILIHAYMNLVAIFAVHSKMILITLNNDVTADHDSEEEDTGIYTVKGQTYLEGKKHEDKLRTGVACEVNVEVQ